MKEKICIDCGRTYTHGGRGLCPNDYAKRKRYGTLPPLKTRGPDAQCKAPEGCTNMVGRSGARGLCPKHYQRLVKSAGGLEQPVRTAPLAARFRAKISTEPCPCGCDCELWTGGIQPKTGYGNFSIKNKTYLAHRVAWELEKGEIPDDFDIDHVQERGCRHRHCVKITHLEPVPTVLNNRRIPMTEQRRDGLSEAGKRGSAIRWARVRAGEAEVDQAICSRVLAFVLAHPDGSRARQIAEALDMSIHNARQGLTRLAKRKMILGNGSGLYQPLPAEECWRPVRGYAAFYEISDRGNVSALARPRTHGGLLIPQLNSAGFRVVRLSKYGQVTTWTVGRLVLETFCWPPPHPKARAKHGLNGKLDDALSNLHWS